jgi:hypothetical protein
MLMEHVPLRPAIIFFFIFATVGSMILEYASF